MRTTRPSRKRGLSGKRNNVPLSGWIGQVPRTPRLCGDALPVIGHVLGHTDPRSTSVYARLQPEAGRVPLDGYARMLADLDGGNGSEPGEDEE